MRPNIICITPIKDIKGVGVSGYMKLPYTDAKQFAYQKQRTSLYYPVNPKDHEKGIRN